MQDEDCSYQASALVLPFSPLMNRLSSTSKHAPFSLQYFLDPQPYQLKSTAADDGQTIVPVQLKEEGSPFCRPGLAVRLHQASARLASQRLGLEMVFLKEIELAANAEMHPPLQSLSKVIENAAMRRMLLQSARSRPQGHTRRADGVSDHR